MNEPALYAAVVYKSEDASSEPLLAATSSQSNNKSTTTSTKHISADGEKALLVRLRICSFLLGLLVGAATQTSDVSTHLLRPILLSLMEAPSLGSTLEILLVSAVWSILIVGFLALLSGICTSVVAARQQHYREISSRWLFVLEMYYGMGAVMGLCLAWFATVHWQYGIVLSRWIWISAPLLTSAFFGIAMCLLNWCFEKQEEEDEEEGEELKKDNDKLEYKLMVV